MGQCSGKAAGPDSPKQVESTPAAAAPAAKPAAEAAAAETPAAPTAVKKVLFVCTSADKFGPEDHATGVWLDEVACPYYACVEAGHEILLASIAGGEIPVDAASRGEGFYAPAAKKFDEDEKATGLLKSSTKLADVDVTSFDAVYLPGGHGCCTDFVDNAELKACIEHMFAANKIVAACCHGPVALAQCVKPDGTPLVAGLRVSAFSDSEEGVVGHTEKVPWLLESKLKELKAEYHFADDWNPAAVKDGCLITGQNPQSSEKTVALLLEALK